MIDVPNPIEIDRFHPTCSPPPTPRFPYPAEHEPVSPELCVQLTPRHFDFVSKLLLTVSFVSSQEVAILMTLPYLFSDPLGAANSARVEFYIKLRRETDEYDHKSVRKYDGDSSTTFVSLFFRVPFGPGVNSVFLGVCPPQLHPLSPSTFGASSNRTCPIY